MRATWKPHEKHGDLTERSDLPESVFAYPKERKEPMTDESHVRNAVARFDQVTGVSEAERDLAFANIKKAAKHYGVDLSESSWRELGTKPSTGRNAADRKKSARKAATTRKKRGTAKAPGSRKKSTAAKKSTARKKSPSRKKSTVKKTIRKKAVRKKAVRKKAIRKKTSRKTS